MRRLLSLLLLTPAMAACQDLSISISPLSFGAFVAGSGGDVTISPDGLRNTSAGVIGLTRLTTTWSPAKFNMKGYGSTVVGVTFPGDNTFSLTCGGASMPLKNFKVSIASPLVSIGATLSVAPNQKACAYTGQFPVILHFQ